MTDKTPSCTQSR